MSAQFAKTDLYKVLKVPPGATIKEIKVSYRKLAMQLHPDKHDGCQKKAQAFKQLTEAYSVLTDESKRSQYDFQMGNRYSASRRTAPPINYRKVYTSAPPPNWKRTWDHRRHQDMHYGTGMQKEAINMARKSAEAEGAFDYRSKLGKGFSFSQSQYLKDNMNPYSKAPQGPNRVTFDYEEGVMNAKNGRASLNRRERIIEDMYSRRNQRHERHQEERRQREQQRQRATFLRGEPHDSQNGGCAIM